MDGAVCSGRRDRRRVVFADRARPRSATPTPRRARRPADPRWSSPPACCSAPLLIGLAALRGMPHWQSIPSTWDAVWHANTVRFILDTGQASPTHMGELRNVETHDALYYPSTFHALAAVFSQLTGAAPTTAYTLNSLAAAVWLFPVSAATLTWQLLRTRTDEWRTAGAAATAAALSASFTAIPYVEFDTASMPNLAAYGVAVPTMVLVVSALRHRDRIPLAVLALLGVFSVHITGGVVTVLFVVGVVAVRRAVASGPRPARGLRHPVGHRGADGAAAAAAVPRRAAAGRDHRRARVRHPRGQEARPDRRGRAAHPPPQRLPDPVGADRAGRRRRGRSCWSGGSGGRWRCGCCWSCRSCIRRRRSAARSARSPASSATCSTATRGGCRRWSRCCSPRRSGIARVHAGVGRGRRRSPAGRPGQSAGPGTQRRPPSWWPSASASALALSTARHQFPVRREVRLGDRRRRRTSRRSPTWRRCPGRATP